MTKESDLEVAHIAEAVLDDATLTEWGKRLGLELRVSNVFNQTVSYEAIRNFTKGIGDFNPLYSDEDCARNTRYGALEASPA
ncbi:MaoC family dehydratase N-terminal domain-containing protein [Chloroflexota bacterium]